MSFSPEIVSIVGARPQFVKLAPVARALAVAGSGTHRVIHTGQHYDDRMSEVFFRELELPRPDLDLGVGSGSHGAQTAAMLLALEEALTARRPEVVLVYGDTNSTLAATLAAAKMNIPLAHVEAGLRSFDRSMPEEINRLVADHCCDRLYAPTPASVSNLEAEDLGERTVQCGDVMRDAVLHNLRIAHEKSEILGELELQPGSFGLLTIHRAVNTTTDALTRILSAVAESVTPSLPLVFPVHPRTQSLIETLPAVSPKVTMIDPLPHLDMLRLVEAAAIVVTDSGGLQKEAAFLSTPCLTLREETEWVETVDLGINRLVGDDPDTLHESFQRLVGGGNLFDTDVEEALNRHYGTGNAATVIVRDLLAWLPTAAGREAHNGKARARS